MRPYPCHRASLWAATLIAVACGAPDTPQRMSDVTLTPEGLGPVRLCSPLDSVGALLGTLAPRGARDTTFVGEDDSTWPGKVADLIDGGTAEFESSWIDSARVWRIGTTARQVRTAHGLRVDDRLQGGPAGSGPLQAELAEGQLVIEFTGDGVAALVDTASERVVYTSDGSAEDALTKLPRGARVRKLIVAGNCDPVTPAS